MSAIDETFPPAASCVSPAGMLLGIPASIALKPSINCWLVRASDMGTLLGDGDGHRPRRRHANGELGPAITGTMRTRSAKGGSTDPTPSTAFGRAKRDEARRWAEGSR